MSNPVSQAEREVYLQHIARLQEEKSLLAEVIVDERRARQDAWRFFGYWMQQRSIFRLWQMLDLIGEVAAWHRTQSTPVLARSTRLFLRLLKK